MTIKPLIDCTQKTLIDCTHQQTAAYEWTCPTCGHVSQSSHPPHRRCGSITPTQVQPPAPRGPWDSEHDYQATIPHCQHRGPVLETNIPCMACGSKNQLYQVYACALHGECTLGNRNIAGKPRKQPCTTCEDRPAEQDLRG